MIIRVKSKISPKQLPTNNYPKIVVILFVACGFATMVGIATESLGGFFFILLAILIPVLFGFNIKILFKKINSILRYKSLKRGNLTLWKKHKKNRNFLNHHNYHQSKELRALYESDVFNVNMKSNVRFTLVIATLIFLLTLIYSGGNIFVAIVLFFLIGFLLFGVSFIGVLKHHILVTKREKLKIFSVKRDISYYHKEGRNKIFFY